MPICSGGGGDRSGEDAKEDGLRPLEVLEGAEVETGRCRLIGSDLMAQLGQLSPRTDRVDSQA